MVDDASTDRTREIAAGALVGAIVLLLSQGGGIVALALVNLAGTALERIETALSLSLCLIVCGSHPNLDRSGENPTLESCGASLRLQQSS